MSERLSFAEFQATLAELLGLRAEQLRPEASFVADLGVDSLRMVGVLLRLQEIGLDLPPELAWQMHTVDDAYRFYQQAGQ